MPRFKFYATKLDKEHKFVASNTRAYLSTLDAIYTTPDIDVVYDADTLKIDIPYPIGIVKFPNYAVAVNEYDVPQSFYHVNANSLITHGIVSCDLTLDLWAMATASTSAPKITGTLVSAHDFADIAWNDRFYSNFTYPVKPERGRLVETLPTSDEIAQTDLVAIMSVTIIADSEELTILVSSVRIGYGDRTRMRAYIQNMSRARGITYNNKTHEVKSINKMWIIPAFCAADGITGVTGNATLELDEDGVQNLSVWWVRQTFNLSQFFENRDFTLRHYIISGDRYVPAINVFGNFGTNVEYTLNGVIRRPVKIDWSVDWNTGYIAAYMRTYGENIDLMPSLTVNISAQVANERALSRQLNDTLGILSGVIALGGSIAVKSPIGIAGAAASVTGTIANIASRVNYAATSIEGNAMLNLYSANDATGAIEALPAFGYLKFEISNIGEVMAELRRVGFVGEYFVQNLSLKDKITSHYTFDYTGTYRRFVGAIVYTDYTRARDEITRMCETGFTVYYTETGNNFGTELFVPLNFTSADE